MNILKCKMCGGNIEVNQDMTIGTCLHCGSTMTIPRIENDKKLRLFNRANEYRVNNEFDKAYSAYEIIISEDEQEAEAYWGMLLSEYGVEYVEDPATKKRVPTCHRTQMQAIKTTKNYELACKYADAERRSMYEDEADAIDKLQKKIIAVSSKVEPYDVFICYKETDDATGERTADSVLAQEIYDQLTEKGLRVFFSRITLEDKLGKDYEPYIYSALTSSKVMIVVTTSNENCEAVWVKNEWMRFMSFMKEDKEKVLIPAYKDMSAYELPGELTRFQAQDMNKVGAVQDLVHAVTKLFTRKKSEDNQQSIEELLEYKEKTEKEKKKSKKTKTIIAVAIIAVVVVVGLGFLFTTMSEASRYFKKAEAAFENGEFQECIKYTEKALECEGIQAILLNKEEFKAFEVEILKWQIEDMQNRYTAISQEDVFNYTGGADRGLHGFHASRKKIDKVTRRELNNLDNETCNLIGIVDADKISNRVNNYYFYDPEAIDNETYREMLIQLPYIEHIEGKMYRIMGMKTKIGEYGKANRYPGQ